MYAHARTRTYTKARYKKYSRRANSVVMHSVAAQKLDTNFYIPAFLQRNALATGYNPAVAQAAKGAWMTH